MTNARLPVGALACAIACTLMPAPALATSPEPGPNSDQNQAPIQAAQTAKPAPAPTRVPKPAKRKLVAGGVLIGLGFAVELSGTVISTGCVTGNWCSRGAALAFGHPDGPNRLTMVLTGPSTTYLAGRAIAMPLLLNGFMVTMVGLTSVNGQMSSWTDRRRRRLGWSLLGSGLGVLVGSMIMRGVFLRTGTCQTPECVHGLDQASLWLGRGLTFTGAGVLVQGAANRVEFGISGGPSSSFGLSFDGRF